jgi:hypothetical protein
MAEQSHTAEIKRRIDYEKESGYFIVAAVVVVGGLTGFSIYARARQLNTVSGLETAEIDWGRYGSYG